MTVPARADVRFTPRERAIMTTAADYLEQRAGVHWSLSFDLDISPAPVRENQIWRSPADTLVVVLLDARFGGTVLGWTRDESPKRTFLIPNRAPSTFLFMHVVEHELLHIVGCDHVADPKSVLYVVSRAGQFEALELTADDLDELERATARRAGH